MKRLIVITMVVLMGVSGIAEARHPWDYGVVSVVRAHHPWGYGIVGVRHYRGYNYSGLCHPWDYGYSGHGYGFGGYGGYGYPGANVRVRHSGSWNLQGGQHSYEQSPDYLGKVIDSATTLGALAILSH